MRGGGGDRHRDEKEAASGSGLGQEYCLTVHTEPNEWVCWSTAFPQYQFGSSDH